MIIRYNKEANYDINSLRNIYTKSLKEINESLSKIDILSKYQKKKSLKNFLVRVLSFGMLNYQNELIKLCKDEIKAEKSKIIDNTISFEYLASPISQTLEKLSSLYSQLNKMKIFYQIDPTYYNYNQLKTSELKKDYFTFKKKNNILTIKDKENSYDLNSLFIAKSDKSSKLLELFSFDNVSVDTKQVYYFSNKKLRGLKLKLQTWLYHNDDYSKDTKFDKNPKVYLYAFRLVKMTFNSKDFTKEFTFLGSDLDKMSLFYNLLLEYLEFLKGNSFDIERAIENKQKKNNEIYELFKENKDYIWVIFAILLDNKDMNKVNIHALYKKYNLNYNDLISIINLLREYSFFELTLGLELLPKYKYNEVKNHYDELMSHNKEELIKGDNNG